MDLLKQIELTREKMLSLGNQFGRTHKKTLKVSEKLDKLILKAMKKGIAV